MAERTDGRGDRRSAGFTLLELLIAIALATLLLLVAFHAVQAATRTMANVNRLALENRMMRAGVQAAFDDADFWTFYDDPLDPARQGLRGATQATPGGEAMAYAPQVAFGQPFTPVKDLPQPDHDRYASGDVALLSQAERWARLRPPTSFRPVGAASYPSGPALGDPLLEPDWLYVVGGGPTTLEAEEARARTLDQARGLDPWRPYQANDPRRWFRGLPTEQPAGDRGCGRYGLMNNLRSFPIAGFGSDPRWPRVRNTTARLERPGDLVPSGPFGPYYGWNAPPALPAKLASAALSQPAPPAPPPQGLATGLVAPDPATGRLSPPPAPGTVPGGVRQTAWTWYANQMTWLRDAFGDYGMLDYLPSNTLLQTYGMRLGLDTRVSLAENYLHTFEDTFTSSWPAPVAGTGLLAAMPATYAFVAPVVTPGVWYPASSHGLPTANDDRQQGWVNSPDAANYVWVDEGMDLRLAGTGEFRRPDGSVGKVLPGMTDAYRPTSYAWKWSSVATNVVGSFTNSTWEWAVPLVPFSPYTGAFVTGRGINVGTIRNDYAWGEDYSQSTAQYYAGQPERQRVAHRRRWASASDNYSFYQTALENRSLLVLPLMPQRPEQWPALQVSASRLLVKGRQVNVYKVRWSDPVTGQIAELDFKLGGSSLRGARQQRARDGGWARFSAAESDPFRSLAPANDNSPTLDSPAAYDPAALRHP